QEFACDYNICFNSYLHPFHDFIRDDKTDMIWNQISYTKILEQKSLNFDNNCLDYSNRGFISQADCRENCILQKFVTKYQQIPQQISYVPSLHVQWNNLTFTKQRDKTIEFECSQKCIKSDCLTIEFTALDYRY